MGGSEQPPPPDRAKWVGRRREEDGDDEGKDPGVAYRLAQTRPVDLAGEDGK